MKNITIFSWHITIYEISSRKGIETASGRTFPMKHRKEIRPKNKKIQKHPSKFVCIRILVSCTIFNTTLNYVYKKICLIKKYFICIKYTYLPSYPLSSTCQPFPAIDRLPDVLTTIDIPNFPFHVLLLTFSSTSVVSLLSLLFYNIELRLIEVLQHIQPLTLFLIWHLGYKKAD